MRTASFQQRKSVVRASDGPIDSGRVRSLARVRRSLLLILGVVFSISIPVSAMAIDNGESLNLGFPRLGMTWPDGAKQSVSDIARWDYVLLNQRDKGIIPALRVAHPGIILLTSTNAQELMCVLSVPPGNSGNVPIRDVPNEWILTQCGSTLTAGVGPSNTTFRVGNSSRFRSGDLCVIENELVKVTSVQTGSISVTRGLLPEKSVATSHSAGARVAAVVTFWPDSVVMNLTGYCPRVTVDPSIGPETWGEYNARVGARLLAGADWDGLFIDRGGRNASFVLNRKNGVVNRSIDARRTNIPVTDGYAAFNASYRAALLDYESRLRAAAPDRLILLNNGDTNYGLLNGSSHENHPSSEWPIGNWQSLIFSSPNGANGTYSDWIKYSLQPNLTSNLTYEDESSPVSGAVFVNPFGTPGWHPNYRKMRFGLGTTLMNDGFFDYEMNTSGHGAGGLMWFDEYDNAGREREYLGQPVAAARLALPPLSSADKLRGHGAFSSSSQLDAWKTWTLPGYSAKGSLSNHTARIAVTGPSRTKYSSAQFYHDNIAVTRGTVYTLSFRARASRRLNLGVGAVKAGTAQSRLAFGQMQLGTAWKAYRLEDTAVGTDSAARLLFLIGDKTATVYFDDVKLQTGKRWEVYRRDYSKGIALVNPTARRVTVPLGNVYRRLLGTQDPITNNGAYVSSATLASQDGLVLLKTTPLSVSGDRTIGYGATASVAGWLKTVDGTPLAGRKVTLYESSNQSTWTRAATTTTTVSGGYSFTVRPAGKRYYRTRFHGDADNLQGFSRVSAVNVRVSVSAPVAPSRMYHSKDYLIYGYLKPKHASGTYPVRIYKWRWVSGKWKSYGYTNGKAYNFSTSAYTKYARSVRLPYAGMWRVRAYAPADSRHAATWSSGFDYVTVK